MTDFSAPKEHVVQARLERDLKWHHAVTKGQLKLYFLANFYQECTSDVKCLLNSVTFGR